MAASNRGILTLEQYSPEIQEQLKLDLQSIQAGRRQDALLIKAMAFNVPFSEFMSVAKKRGKSWRFLSALSDMAVEANSVGMLYLVRFIVGQNLTLTIVEKALLGMDALQMWEDKFEDDTHKMDIIAEGREEIKDWQRSCVAGFKSDVMKRSD